MTGGLVRPANRWLAAITLALLAAVPIARGQDSPTVSAEATAPATPDLPTRPPATEAVQVRAPETNPALARVSLTLADPSPVIGLSGETMISIEVDHPPTVPMPMPRMLCSAGQIEDLGREGPAKFTARYILPSSRFPQPAILVVEFSDTRSPLRGMAMVPLRAAASPAFRTDPGAQVTMRVSDRDFGPQVSGADGMVHVPVVVPPGVDFALARSVNLHGKATEEVVDLHVPYSQRVLLVAPEILSAGEVGEVAVYAAEPSGRAANAAMLVLRAGKNRVQPLGSRVSGEARFLVTAPKILRQRSMRIEAQLKDQSTTLTATRIALVPSGAAGLVLEPESSRLGRDPASAMRVFIGAEDAFGNPVDAGRAGVLVDGKPAAVKSDADGVPMVTVEAPRPSSHRDEVIVEGVLDDAHVFKRIPVGVPARLMPPQAPEVIAYPKYAVTPRLGVLTNFGPLVGATFFVDAMVYPSHRLPGLGLGLSLGILESRFAAESAGGISHVAISTVPVSVEVRQHWVFGRAFAGVGVGAGFAMAEGRVSSYGATTSGSSVGAIAEASVEGGFLLRKAHLVLAIRYVGLYLSDFSSGDHLAGSVGGVMADVGYRRVW